MAVWDQGQTLNMVVAIEKMLMELEAQAGHVKGEKARALRDMVKDALAEAEAKSAPADIINRLDDLMVVLTEASRDVCTNTKCPHYYSKCKMR